MEISAEDDHCSVSSDGDDLDDGKLHRGEKENKGLCRKPRAHPPGGVAIEFNPLYL